MAKQSCGFCGKKAKMGEAYCPECGNRLEEWVEPPFSTLPSYDDLHNVLTGMHRQDEPWLADTEGKKIPEPFPRTEAMEPPPSPDPPPLSGNPPPAYPPAPARSGYNPVPDPAVGKRGNTALAVALSVIAVAVVGVMAAGIFFGITQKDRWERERTASAVERIEEPLKQKPEGNGMAVDDYSTVLLRMERDLRRNGAESAFHQAMQLVLMDCDDPHYLRAAASVMAENGQPAYACRLFLLAYGLSGQEEDLLLAFGSAEPAQVAQDMREPLEALFGKPLEQLKWEEIGRVKTCVQTGDAVALDFASGETGDSRLAAPVDTTSATAPVYFLYGLTDLTLAGGEERLECTGLGGLRLLERLTLKGLNGGEDLTGIHGAHQVRELTVEDRCLTSLDGLEGLPLLHKLTLSGTGVEGLEQLADFPQLEALSLEKNQSIASIAPLEGLELTALSIKGGDIGDLAVIGNMKGLREVALVDTALKDASFLFDLELTHLVLTSNSKLISVAGISKLSSLESLEIFCRDMDGIMEIAELSQLRRLKLIAPSTLSMARGLTGLEELLVGNPTTLESLAPLSEMHRLHTLVLYSTGSVKSSIYDISLAPLEGLEGLRHVELTNLSVYGDCSAVFRLAELEYLDISGSELGVPSPDAVFSGLTGLRTLKANGARLLTNLHVQSDGFFTNVWYDDYNVGAFSSQFAAMQRLERLDCRGSRLEDLAFATRLESLVWLDAADNYITDASPLALCSSLSYADLSDNPVADWSAVEREGLTVSR